MKCEGFSTISDFGDYLNKNLLITHYCGFDITKHRPSYWTFDRFLENIDHSILSDIMKSQVLFLAGQGVLFSIRQIKSRQSKVDTDCKPVSNQSHEKNFQFFFKTPYYRKSKENKPAPSLQWGFHERWRNSPCYTISFSQTLNDLCEDKNKQDATQD